MIRIALFRSPKSFSAIKGNGASRHFATSPMARDLSPKKYAIAGSAFLGAGGIYGMTGVLGGVLGIKALTGLPGLRLTHLQATGNTTGALMTSTLSNAIVWFQEGHCDVVAAACLGGCGLSGVVLGIKAASCLPDRVLRIGFAMLLCGVLAPMSLSKVISESAPPRSESEASLAHACKERQLTALRHCAIGACVGILTGALAVGDTPLIIAYLTASGWSQKEAIGTAFVATVPTNILAFAIHLMKGNAGMVLAPFLMFFMSLGAALGAHYASASLSDEQVQWLFAGCVMVIGIATGHAESAFLFK